MRNYTQYFAQKYSKLESFPFAQPITGQTWGKVLTNANIIISNILTLLPLVCMFVGLGIATGGAYIGFEKSFTLPEGLPVEREILGGILIGIGVAVCAFFAYHGLRYSGYFGDRYLETLFGKSIGSRHDTIVKPDLTDTYFIEVVPRKNWQRLMLETATDIGYLTLDTFKREILFEGDKERYRIPGTSFDTCTLHQFSTSPQGGLEHTMIVLHSTKDPEKQWELSFSLRHGSGIFGKQQRYRNNLELKKIIDGIMH